MRAVEQAADAPSVVAVNPIPQRLAIHTRLTRRLLSTMSLQQQRYRQHATRCVGFLRATSLPSPVIFTVIAVLLHLTTTHESRQSEPLQFTLESTQQAAGIISLAAVGSGHNRFNELRRRGLSQFRAAVAAGSPTGFWRMSGYAAVQAALRNHHFDSLGLPRLYVPGPGLIWSNRRGTRPVCPVVWEGRR